MLLLVPSWLDLATWAGVVFATLALMGLGRLVSAGAAAPETAVVAGWGAACVVLTLWGAITPVSLRWPAAVVVACGVAGLTLPRLRPSRAEWRGVLRLVAVALPLIAILLSARPSLPDTFLNLLPNAAYLYDHGYFPADVRPPAYSFLPGAPYNMQLAALIASLVTPGFPASAMIGLNLMMQLAAALLLARLVERDDDGRGAPSWAAVALGFLLAMALNPGFVPRYHLSAYSEPSVAVSLAFAGWCAIGLLNRIASHRPAAMNAWLLALTLCALVNIKQDSVALAVGLIVAAAGLALADRAAARRDAFRLVVLAAVPPALLYLVWRWYVLTHFALGELKPMPIRDWQFDALPVILWHMLEAIGEKVTFFATLAAVLAAAVIRWRRRGLDPPTRAGVLLLGLVLIYNAALIGAYIGHFPGTIGSDAHSYFRYNTHLSLLMMVVAVVLVRANATIAAWAMRLRPRRVVPIALVAVALVVPVAFLRFLRFDLEVPQLRVWALAREAAPRLTNGDRLALVLPGDNGSVATMLESLLRLTPPRRPDIAVTAVSAFDPPTLAALDAAGYRRALLSCAAQGAAGVPAGEAGLLIRDASGWHAVAVWPYAPPPRHARWSKVLSAAPLCLGG